LKGSQVTVTNSRNASSIPADITANKVIFISVMNRNFRLYWFKGEGKRFS